MFFLYIVTRLIVLICDVRTLWQRLHSKLRYVVLSELSIFAHDNLQTFYLNFTICFFIVVDVWPIVMK